MEAKWIFTMPWISIVPDCSLIVLSTVNCFLTISQFAWCLMADVGECCVTTSFDIRNLSDNLSHNKLHAWLELLIVNLYVSFCFLEASNTIDTCLKVSIESWNWKELLATKKWEWCFKIFYVVLLTRNYFVFIENKYFNAIAARLLEKCMRIMKLDEKFWFGLFTDRTLTVYVPRVNQGCHHLCHLHLQRFRLRFPPRSVCGRVW